MKKILITGVNSYVGNSLFKWLEKEPEKYSVDRISLRDSSWKEQDFSIYDVIVHVAGIAHRKETKKNKHLYYKINRDLAIEVAQKAKQEGVGFFVFLSSMSVYGKEKGVICKNTPLQPKSSYGKSKLQAEELIKTLSESTFKIAILRPPMIYGKGCKGNYRKLSKLAKVIPLFPNINNKRSMIYIDNLSEYIKIIIDKEYQSVFFPQNPEFVKTSEMVKLIAETNDKKICLTKVFNPIIHFIKNDMIQKLFGDLYYSDKLMSKQVTDSISFIGFEESIKRTEE